MFVARAHVSTPPPAVMPRRPLSAALFGSALALFVLPLAGCEGGASPYEDQGAEATEGTGEVPDGALNRALDPGDAGTVGEANLEDEGVGVDRRRGGSPRRSWIMTGSGRNWRS